MGRKRRTFSAKQKSEIALAALREHETLSQIAEKYNVHPSQVTLWKRQLLEASESVFSRKKAVVEKAEEAETAKLYEHIGRLKVELDWLKKKTESF